MRANMTVAFEEKAWLSLIARLDEDLECAWVLHGRLVGAPGDGSVTLLVSNLVDVPDDAYDVRERDELSIKTNGWLPAFGRADVEGTVPIFVHTHPGGSPHQSRRDLVVDEELARVAAVRTGLGHYGSLVIGGTTNAPMFAGRFKAVGSDWRPVDRLRVVGERLDLLAPANKNGKNSASAVFDRHVLAFGQEGQELLEQLRVGVVGAGGTGSAVIEQLLRLGVGELVIIDPETLTDTNVTRVYGSTLNDVDKPKVDVASEHGKAIGLGSLVSTKQGTVLDKSTAELLVHCDVVFGCTDDNAGRIVLTRMPQALLQLLVDCGVAIDSRAGVVFDIFGRVSVISPTSACLVCMGEVDPQRASAETMTTEEHESRLREGYAPELDTRDPSVITYTTVTASFAVNELLSRLFGYCDVDPANRLLIRIGSRATSKMRRDIQGNHRCGRSELLAVGTRDPFLDYGWRDA